MSMIDKFIAWEHASGLFEQRIDGFQYWPYIRFDLYVKMEAILNKQEEEKKAKPSLTNLLHIALNCLFYTTHDLKQHDIVLITHPRRVWEVDSFRCIYTDDIARVFPKRALSLEKTYSYRHMLPAASPNLCMLDYIDTLPLFFYTLAKYSFGGIRAQCARTAEEIDRLLHSAFGFSVGKSYLEGRLFKLFHLHKKKSIYFRKLLDKIKPKVVVEAVSYSTNNMVLNEEAYRLGIPVIELQHGVIGRGHIAYNFAAEQKGAFLPTYYLLFSDYWRTTAAFPVPMDRLIVTGFPYQEEQMRKHPKVPRKSAPLRIIVFSQPRFSQKIYRMVLNLLEILDFPYTLIYKLHPHEYELPDTRWDVLDKKPGVMVVRDNKQSLYHYLANADVQVGAISTALFEGLAYGLQTFIYHIENTDAYMGDACKMGYAVMFDDAKALKELLRAEYMGTPSGVEHSPFFVQNALHKTIEAIMRIGGLQSSEKAMDE